MLRKVNILTVLAVLGVLTFEYVVPYGAVWVYGEDYKSLMYECDNAMRDHFIAKKAVELSPNEMNILNLDAAQLSLMSCHDYDKMRKHLQVLNVTDTGLENLGLSALEERDYDLIRFVKTHEIRF